MPYRLLAPGEMEVYDLYIPKERSSTLPKRSDKEEEWEIHVSTRDAHYLKMNLVAEEVTFVDLSIRFGDDPSCAEQTFSVEPTLKESPTGYTIIRIKH
eukprot:scaffold122608_cov27-Attheya_sp.AAC.1